MHEVVAVHEVSTLQAVPLKVYPAKQVKQPLLVSQVAQGKGQAATHELLERVYPFEQVRQAVAEVQVAQPVGQRVH